MSEFRFPSVILPDERISPLVTSSSPASAEKSTEFRFPAVHLDDPRVKSRSDRTVGSAGGPAYLLPTQEPQKMVVAPAPLIYTGLFSFGADDRGVIYRPALILFPEDVKGLVLMAHGQLPDGWDKTYQYTMDRIGRMLAGFGFICISVQPRALNGNFAAGTKGSLLRHLDNALKTLPFVASKPIALIGHSQAGGPTVDAALDVQEGLVAGVSKISAVIGLAPTAIAGVDSVSLATSYLCLQGASDGDSPPPADMEPAEIRGLVAYNQVSRCSRFFMWMFYCNHRQYLKRNPALPATLQETWPDNFPTTADEKIGLPAQNIAAQQYITMFLLWKLLGKNEYGPVFTGGKYVDLDNPDEKIRTDLQKYLKVFPRFDVYRPKLLSLMPSGAKFQGMKQGGIPISNDNPAVFGPLNSMGDPSLSTDSTNGFVVEWDHSWSKSPRVEITIQSGLFEKYAITAVCFHAVLMAEEDLIAEQQAVNVQVYIWYNDAQMKQKTSALVPAYIEPPWSGPLRPASVLSTIRIPVKDFMLGMSIKSATRLVIDFTTSSKAKGRVAVAGFFGDLS